MKKIKIVMLISLLFSVSCSDMVAEISDPEGTKPKVSSTGVPGVWDETKWDQSDWGN